MRRLSGALAAVAVAGAAPACQQQTSIVSAAGAIRTVRTEIDGATARRLVERMASERRRVRAWWGEGFTGPIRVGIAEEFRIAMALIPAWRGDRGRMDVSVRTVLQGATPTLHELVHIEAPNGNRFLAEGLAVYLQTRLDGVPAYPNFGRDLHQAASAAAQRTSLTELDATVTPTTIELTGPFGRRTAYLVAGSFVRFLVERHGKAKFRRLYALTPFEPGRRPRYSPGRYEGIYGRSLSALEKEWRGMVTRRGG